MRFIVISQHSSNINILRIRKIKRDEWVTFCFILFLLRIDFYLLDELYYILEFKIYTNKGV